VLERRKPYTYNRKLYIAYKAADYRALLQLCHFPSFDKGMSHALDALNQVHKATEVSQLALHLTNENEVVRAVAKRRLQELHKQRKPWWCWMMNLIDFRYWLCDCHYEAPYGKVISAWCTKHG